MLSDRRQKVLQALIEEYVERAMPVGSRTLTEHYDLGVSSATVRNELSALEEGGYIFQPHTSSGRVPTDFGYRTFVDSLIDSGVVNTSSEYDGLAEQLRQYATELDDLMEKTSAALARLTDCLSIVVAPTIHDLVIKQVTLVCMDASHIMLVLVTEDGQVLNRHIGFSEAVSPEQIAAIQQFLNEKLAGKSLSNLESGVYSTIVNTYCKTFVEGAHIETVLSEIVLCLREACHETGAHHSHRLGLRALMSQPEFSHSSALVPIMQVLEDETVLLQLMDMQAQPCDKTHDGSCDGCASPNDFSTSTRMRMDESSRKDKSGIARSSSSVNSKVARLSSTSAPTVTIGKENSSFGLPGVSVVAGKYGRGDSAGVVAVIGPTRMNYSKVINAVRVATQALRED